MGREVIGLALAIQEFTGKSLSNGAKLGGVFSTEQMISLEALKNIKKTFQEKFGGTSNANRTLFLDSGLKYQTTSQNNQEMEFIALSRLVNLDICRLFRVPPPAVGILDDATYSNITEQSRILVQNCIRPWTVRFEQAMNRALLSERDRETYFIEHSLDGLLRGNLKDRYEAYKVGRDGGWLSINDIRQRENMSVIEGGDEYQTIKRGNGQ
jgi:HK97 family phage portal protein